MKFEIKGEFNKPGRPEKNQRFEKRLEADSEELAREKLYCLMGSHHGMKRHHVRIYSLEEI